MSKSEWSKLKAFADDKIKLAKMMVFVLDRVESIVGKGEKLMVVDSIFSFPTVFSKGVLLRVIKSRDCVVKS